MADSKDDEGESAFYSCDESKESGTFIIPGKAPSVLSLTSVAEPREDATPDLRNCLSLVFSVSLCLSGEILVFFRALGSADPFLSL